MPLGENETENTPPKHPCEGSAIRMPDTASHIRIVVSSDPDAMRVPSGENATDVTPPECPVNTCQIPGHCWDVPVATDNVFRNSVCICCRTVDLEGENGKAKR